MISSSFSVIVAARFGSKRLPGKALLPLGGVPMLEFLILRLKQSKRIDRFLLATTKNTEDQALVEVATRCGIPSTVGEESDVMNRFILASRSHPSEWVIRITADCPFLDGATLDHFTERASAILSMESNASFFSTKGQFPVGLDFEAYRTKDLEAYYETSSPSSEEREHLTLHYYQKPTDIFSILPPLDWPKISETFTIDTPADYEKATLWIDTFGPQVSTQDLVRRLGSVL